MTPVVSYAYATMNEERPTLMEQFNTCRAYANARGYQIVAELNDIDEHDHHVTDQPIEAIHKAIADTGATVILVYQPSAWAQERLKDLGATIEDVDALM